MLHFRFITLCYLSMQFELIRWIASLAVRRLKYIAERRHIINNLHQGRLVNSRRSAAAAVFKCSLNKRSQFPVPLSLTGNSERHQRGAEVTSNDAQVTYSQWASVNWTVPVADTRGSKGAVAPGGNFGGTAL